MSPSSSWAVGVCGFGRCGSTMAMMMLAAGGLPPVDGCELPPHELGSIDEAWHAAAQGRSIKLLGPVTEYPITTRVRWRFLWLDRDPVEQARSTIKFVRVFGLAGEADESDVARVARMARTYRRDRSRMLGKLHGLGQVVKLQYELALLDPRRAAQQLRDGLWPALDIDAAAAVVHDRDGRCLPDLSVELAYLESARLGNQLPGPVLGPGAVLSGKPPRDQGLPPAVPGCEGSRQGD